MADYYAEQAMIEQFMDDVNEYSRSNCKQKPYKTEDVLNSTKWKVGQGVVHELHTLEKDHLQNILYFLYKRRDRYWMNCRDVSIIEKFENGDDFFQRVIRNSTIWSAIIDVLNSTENQGFNFEFTIPGGRN